MHEPPVRRVPNRERPDERFDSCGLHRVGVDRGRDHMAVTLLAIISLAVSLLMAAWYHLSVGDRDGWAISIYSGPDPLHLKPHASIKHHPVIRAKDVTDAPARFVADPFMLRKDGRWYMFLEIFNEASRRGEIALAVSPDANRWQYQGVVLREPFHLSYPQVFEWNGVYYMLPETRAASAVRLYRATRFPDEWTFACELLRGPFADSTLVFQDGLWWLFAYQRDNSLSLYYAPEPIGSWTLHPSSPIVTRSRTASRPAGRIVRFRGSLLRYAQDETSGYGGALRAIQIDEMTTSVYSEHEISDGPILRATGRGWNAHGMHHLDAHQLGEGNWIACVDGNHVRRVVNWRKGAARFKRILRNTTA